MFGLPVVSCQPRFPLLHNYPQSPTPVLGAMAKVQTGLQAGTIPGAPRGAQPSRMSPGWHGRGQQPPQLQHSLISPSWQPRPAGNATRRSSSASGSTRALSRRCLRAGLPRTGMLRLPMCHVSTAAHRDCPRRRARGGSLMHLAPASIRTHGREGKANTFCQWTCSCAEWF